MSYVLVVIALAGAWALHLTWLAARLRRLHARSDAAAQALSLQLTRRALVVNDVATDHVALLVDSAATLHFAVWLALHAAADEREAAESDLTRALQVAVRDNPMPAEQREQIFKNVVIQNRRVEMARVLYNDAVRDTCALRRRWLLRVLRLAAHLEHPKYFDIDTTLSMTALTASPPEALVTLVARTSQA